MFDKYGEFDSYEEINEAAADALAQEDKTKILELAEENGIDKEDAEDFWLGEIEELTTPLLAALGKIDIEAKEIDIFGVFQDWKAIIYDLCQSNDDISLQVRKKGKSLVKCFGSLLAEESKQRKKIDKKICKAAGLPENIPISTLTKKDHIRLIKEYYER